MALFIVGKTECPLCGRVIQEASEATLFPAFLKPNHRFHRFSDAALHSECFQAWPDHVDFERLFKRFREMWESRPKNLPFSESENWAREAFKEFDNTCPGTGNGSRKQEPETKGAKKGRDRIG